MWFFLQETESLQTPVLEDIGGASQTTDISHPGRELGQAEPFKRVHLTRGPLGE